MIPMPMTNKHLPCFRAYGAFGKVCADFSPKGHDDVPGKLVFGDEFGLNFEVSCYGGLGYMQMTYCYGSVRCTNRSISKSLRISSPKLYGGVQISITLHTLNLSASRTLKKLYHLPIQQGHPVVVIWQHLHYVKYMMIYCPDGRVPS